MLSPFHWLLALLVVLFWGVNFVVIKIGLHTFPPILLSFGRFIFTALPAVFFLKRPAIPWSQLFGYGIILFALQFSFLFSGMKLGVSAGIASLIMQNQVFVTIGLAALFLGERPSLYQLWGALIAFIGVAIIALHQGGDVSLIGLVLVILAAVSWGIGNVIAKSFKQIDPLSLVVWGSLVASPCLLILSFWLEGAGAWQASYQSWDWSSAGSVLYLAYLSTIIGYGVWSFLLRRYSAAMVAPLTLLVPLVGMGTSALWLREGLPMWKLGASSLVLAGLATNIFGAKLMMWLKTKVSLAAMKIPTR